MTHTANVTSNDGTPIAVWRTGRGPPLLDWIGTPASVLGHSHDALCGLEAAVGIMHGQQHVAMHSSPELFVRTVLDFLDG